MDIKEPWHAPFKQGWYQITVEMCGRNGMPERRELSIDLGIDPEFVDFEGHVFIANRDGYDTIYDAVREECGDGEWPSIRYVSDEPAGEE